MTSVSSTSSLIKSTYTSATSKANATNTSKIDWQGLIEEAVAAKLTKADKIEVKISNNEARAAAYKKLQSLLGGIKDAADNLRAASGTTADNAFKSRAAYLTANGSGSASSAMGATVEDGSDIGNYDITISQIALAHKVAGGMYDSSRNDLGYEGVFSLGTDAGTSAEITITKDMNLNEIAEAINATTGKSGVKATVLQVSDDEYRLILSAENTGETMTASYVSGDDVLTGIGITDSQDGSFSKTLQNAQNAIFTLDGIEVTRASNTVSDLIDGVTLLLYQETTGDSSITLEINTDLSSVKTAISTLVDAYNAYRDYYIDQTAYVSSDDSKDTSDDTKISTGTLFADGTTRNINTGLMSALTAMIGKESMALLGLSFDKTNHLVLNENTLDDALIDDPKGVESLLTFSMTSSSAKVLLLSRGTTVPEDFTLDITVNGDGKLASASVNGDSSLFKVDGTRIIGAKDTIYEGYTFVFVGSSNVSANLSFSTGLAELLYNTTEKASNDTDGTLKTLMDGIDGDNDDLKAKVTDITARAETYRSNLTTRYAEYQAAIATAESLLGYLTTLIDTWNSSS